MPGKGGGGGQGAKARCGRDRPLSSCVSGPISRIFRRILALGLVLPSSSSPAPLLPLGAVAAACGSPEADAS